MTRLCTINKADGGVIEASWGFACSAIALHPRSTQGRLGCPRKVFLLIFANFDYCFFFCILIQERRGKKSSIRL